MALPNRADHVGSLLRPERLGRARHEHAEGRIDAAELRAVEDECVAEAVAKQQHLGLGDVTDGEFRRSWWHFDFLTQLDGVEYTYGQKRIEFKDTATRAQNIAVTGKVDVSQIPMLEDFKYLASVSTAVPKFTIPGPPVLHFRGGRELISESVYPSLDEFFADTTEAYKHIVRGFYEAGCRYLQLDDTVWAYLCSETEKAQSRERGDDPESLPAIYAEMINAVLAEKPADMAITTHCCRGNFRSSWISSGGYEPVAETLLGGIDYDGYFLEYDTDRAGGFEPLRLLPRGRKRVVLGLVTSKSGKLEGREDLLRRIEEAGQQADLDQLCLSPQCGFASTEEGNLLTEEEQWRKLELVVNTAAEIWPED